MISLAKVPIAAVILMVALGFTVNGLLVGPYVLRSAANGMNDFRPFYAAGHLAGTAGLYDTEAMMREQRSICGDCASRNLIFNRPPYYALLLRPLSMVPFRGAVVLWGLAGIAALFAFAWLWPDRRLAVLACAWSMPAYAAMVGGQDVTFALLFVALAMSFEQRGRNVAAGIALGLCALKFHLFVFVPLLVLAQKRWRMAAGAAVCIGSLSLVSSLASGWDWPVRYASYLSANGNNAGQEAMPNLHGLLMTVPRGDYLEGALVLLGAALAWVAMRRRPFQYGLALAVAAGVILNRHSFLADLTLLLPLLLLILTQAIGWARAVAIAGLLPLLYLGVYTGSGILVTRLFVLAVLGTAFVVAFRPPAVISGPVLR